jgi:hypothetical protein
MTSTIRRTFPASLACAGALVLGLSATPAAAQTPSQPQPRQEPQAQQPDQPAPGEPDPRHRQQTAMFRGAQRPMRDIVGLSISTYGAYDDQLTQAGGGEGGGVRGTTGGPYAGVDFGLSITPNMTGRFTFDAQVASGIRYYQEMDQFVAATQGGAVNAGYHFTRRTTLQTRGGFQYSPYLDFTNPLDLDPNLPAGPERVRDYTNATRRTISYDGSVDLTHTRGERTAYTVVAATRRTELLDEPQSSVDTTLSGTITRRLNRRTATRLNFVHRTGQFELNRRRVPVHVNDFEVVLDRDWNRSPTRRTTLTFSLGPSLVDHGGRQLLRAFGGIGVVHPFGRSWDLRATYRRGINFLDGVPEPFLSDATIVTISGLMSRRFDMSLSAGAVLGEVGLESLGTTYDTYTAAGRLRYAITSSTAFYAEYLYDYHKYSGDVSTIIPGQDRTGVRVGVTFFLPILQEAVRPENPTRRGARGR